MCKNSFFYFILKNLANEREKLRKLNERMEQIAVP
jgi:hypothetical protein